MEIARLDADKDLTILAGTLIDGSGNDVIKNAAIEVRRGVIYSIESGVDFDTYRPLGSQLLDLTDLAVLPGFIDCHVHLAMNAEDLNKAIDGWDDIEQVRTRVSGYMKDYLENGVIAIRDGGDRANIGLSARDWVTAGQGPYIAASGEAVYRKGFYGTFLGPGINEISEVEKEIEKQVKAGVSQLKVIQSGLVSFKEYGKVGLTQFSMEELSVIVQMAHEQGLTVMVHASGAEAVETAVRAGVNSIEHGYFVTTETLKLMAEKGTAWIPTVAPLGNLVKSGIVYPGASVDVIRKVHEEHLEKIKVAWDIGVLIGVGTDAGANQVYHGSSYQQELSYYEEAGLKPLEIIKAATYNSAKVVGWDNMMGILEEGKIPFIIGVAGNPEEKVNALKNLDFVLI